MHPNEANGAAIGIVTGKYSDVAEDDASFGELDTAARTSS